MAVPVNRVQHWRTAISNNPPDPYSLPEGLLSLEMSDPMRIWMGVPTSIDPTGRRLLYDASLSGGAGGGSQVTVGDAPPVSPSLGDLWWDSFGGQLYIWYRDASSSQWVSAVNQASGGITDAAAGQMIEAAVAPLREQLASLRTELDDLRHRLVL